MARYVAKVSTNKNDGSVMIDLGECKSLDAAMTDFRRMKLCLNNDNIKVEITEAQEVKAESSDGAKL